ncbi:MAG: HAD family hydrolase [Planctomycetota bacterium]|nr:HAD family hydrolase [Planctomycetota bacterium]
MSDVAKLKAFKPQHPFFVGIDSDGCVFDTMEIKQKECFIPNIIKLYGGQSVSKYLRECAEFVNLYSKWRGVNRFPALLKSFELLAERPEVRARGFKNPDLSSLQAWTERETKLGNPALKAESEKTGDACLKLTYRWSETVNKAVEEMVFGIPPFPMVRESLQKLTGRADKIVCSQTPTEALVREWEEHGIQGFVEFICGQEMGTKTEHLAFASGGKYEPGRVLMIGDALGDLKAAQGNKALFYPIMPGDEDASWTRFHDEAIDKFLGGAFAGDYQKQLIRDFEKRLPETPPWKK